MNIVPRQQAECSIKGGKSNEEKKNKKSHVKFFVALAMVFSTLTGILLGGSLTAYADVAYAAYLVGNSDTAATLANKVVKFNNYDWYIIEDNSTADNAGTVTLLEKNPITASTFHGSSNKYSTSMVMEVLDGLTAESGSFADVADDINTIPSLPTNGYNRSDTYDTVQNVKLYLLSTSEANDLPVAVRKCTQNGGACQLLVVALARLQSLRGASHFAVESVICHLLI